VGRVNLRWLAAVVAMAGNTGAHPFQGHLASDPAEQILADEGIPL
jgi:hypothetical protein